MWDNPRRLNAVAGFLVGLALFAFALAALKLALRSPLFPVRTVDVVTPLKQAPRDAVERAVRQQVGGNFFAARIDDVRSALEQVPWVRSVEVRRVWPDRLEVAIEEHVALARWGSDGLVNTHGEHFAGRGGAALPLFIGPEGTEAELAERYQRFTQILKPLDSSLERVVLTPRYAWQLRLANGMNVMLGRDGDVAEQRLQRFVDVYDDTVGRVPGRHEYVDLRYANGFALRVKG
jgi:cell division protein FtsQ